MGVDAMWHGAAVLKQALPCYTNRRMRQSFFVFITLLFIVEVLNPSSRFIRVGARLKKSKSLFSYTEERPVVRTSPTVKVVSHQVVVKKATPSKPGENTLGKRSPSHKAEPIAKASVIMDHTVSKYEGVSVSFLHDPPPLPLFRPPIAL